MAKNPHRMIRQAPDRRNSPNCSALLLICAVVAACLFVSCTPDSPQESAQVRAEYALAMARQSASIGQFSDAIGYVNAAGASAGWTAEADTLAVEYYQRTGQLDRAVPHLERLNPDQHSSESQRLLANLYLQRKQWTAAFDTLQRIVSRQPDDTWSQFHAGVILAASAPADAIPHLRAAILDPAYGQTASAILPHLTAVTENDLPALDVGARLADAELWSLAEYAFQYAADTNPDSAAPFAYVALARAMQSNDALPWIDAAYRLAPESGTVHLLHAMILRLNDQPQQALAQLIFALEQLPDDPLVHAELGETHRALGNVDEAIYWFDSAVTISDNDPVFVAARDRFLSEEAPLLPEQAILNAMQNRPASSISADNLSAYGWAHHIHGDSELALTQIEEALKLEPGNPRALFDKARVLVDLNRADEAIPLLEQVRATDNPLAEVAGRLLETLQ